VNQLELRPLSLGEILDRTFTLYRNNLLLFVGLAAIPRLPSLIAGLLQLQINGGTISVSQGGLSGLTGSTIAFVLVTWALALVGYLYAQGASVAAVSELYLSRPISISQALRRVTDEIGPLLGALMLNGLVILVGFIFLIVPGVYLMCRLFVVVPAAVIERKGPAESLSRSMMLTKGFAGRAFVILALYFAISIGFGIVVSLPAGIAVATRNITAIQTWAPIQAIVSAILEAFITPILLISSSIFYYDLRVRKEAFDLQMLMDPDGANTPRANLRSLMPEGQ